MARQPNAAHRRRGRPLQRRGTRASAHRRGAPAVPAGAAAGAGAPTGRRRRHIAPCARLGGPTRAAQHAAHREDTAIKPLTIPAPEPLRTRRLLAGLALLCLLAAGCQTTARSTSPINSDDVDTAITLPRMLENVWYRTDVQPANFIPFAAEGTLLVTGDSLQFNGSGGSVTISVRSIRDVLWRVMDGDLVHGWAVIYYVEDGVEKIVGFTAADRFMYHTSNRDLYSAIVKAWRSQGRS